MLGETQNQFFITRRALGTWEGQESKPQREMAEYPWFWGWDEEKRDSAGGRELTGDPLERLPLDE